MNVQHDRRQILPLVRPHFPVLPDDISSDDVHGWLNAQTGLDVPLDEPNGSAFDKWRKVLATQGLPVWNYTQAQLAKIASDGLALKTYVDQFNETEKARLEALAKEAPSISAADLLK